MTKLHNTVIALAGAIALACAAGQAQAQTEGECNDALAEARAAIDAAASNNQLSQSEEDGSRQLADSAANSGSTGDYARCIEVANQVSANVASYINQ